MGNITHIIFGNIIWERKKSVVFKKIKIHCTMVLNCRPSMFGSGQKTLPKSFVPGIKLIVLADSV
jgi:hypothetical protein